MKTIIKSNILALALILSTIVMANAQEVSGKEIRKNVTPLTNSKSYVTALEPLQFEYDADKLRGLKMPDGRQFGFTVEDVEKIAPDLVKTEGKFIPAGKNAYKVKQVKTVDYQKLIPVLAGAIREQQAEIDALRKELEALKARK